jgi:hypothetical protein
MQTPRVNALIDKLIVNFRSIAKPQIAVRGLILSVSDVPDDTYFDETAVAELQKNSTVVACPRLVCFNSQRTHVLSGKSISFVRDYDISGDSYDPAMFTMIDGTTFEVHPTLSGTRNTIQLDLRLVVSANAQKHTETLGLDADAVITQASIMPRGETTTVKTEENQSVTETHRNEGYLLGSQYVAQLDLDLASMDASTLSTQLVVPKGKWVLAAAMNDFKAKDKKIIVLVTAEVLEKP